MKCLKSLDFFGLNLQSIISFHKKIFLGKLQPKDPFGGPKIEKRPFFHLFDFLFLKEEATPFRIFYFSIPHRLGFQSANCIHAKTSLTLFIGP